MKPIPARAILAVIGSIAARGSDPLDFWSNRWTKTNFTFTAIAQGDGNLVVGGVVPFQNEGGAFASTDGVQWTQTLFDRVGILCFGTGRFIADSQNQWLHSSPDGRLWVSRIAPGEEILGSRSGVTFGLGRFWVQREPHNSGAALRYASSDGLNWELVTTNGIRGATIVFCGDRFITTGPDTLMSLDGINFERAEG